MRPHATRHASHLSGITLAAGRPLLPPRTGHAGAVEEYGDRGVTRSHARSEIASTILALVRIAELPAALAEDAVELWHANGLTRPWNDPKADLHRALTGPSSTVLAAQNGDGVLLGTAMVGHDGHRGWVYYLAVRGEFQRTGLGRQLMDAAERWLQERSIPKMNVMVRKTNTAVVAFYEALGYADGEVVVLGKFL